MPVPPFQGHASKAAPPAPGVFVPTVVATASGHLGSTGGNVALTGMGVAVGDKVFVSSNLGFSNTSNSCKVGGASTAYARIDGGAVTQGGVFYAHWAHTIATGEITPGIDVVLDGNGGNVWGLVVLRGAGANTALLDITSGAAATLTSGVLAPDPTSLGMLYFGFEEVDAVTPAAITNASDASFLCDLFARPWSSIVYASHSAPSAGAKTTAGWNGTNAKIQTVVDLRP